MNSAGTLTVYFEPKSKLETVDETVFGRKDRIVLIFCEKPRFIKSVSSGFYFAAFGPRWEYAFVNARMVKDCSYVYRIGEDIDTEIDKDFARLTYAYKCEMKKQERYVEWIKNAPNREKEAKKNQKVIEIKEIRIIGLGIDTHDFETKAKHAIKFLDAGNKVKVSIRFRGREMGHPEIALDLMQRFAEFCADHCTVEKQAKMEGRNMLMFLAPKSSK
jgi:translation initiation factor IF-3